MGYEKEIDMRKLLLALLGFIIFAGLYSLWNAFSAPGDVSQILLPALATVFTIVVVISVGPWLKNRSP
jgi:hypothetical protein